MVKKRYKKIVIGVMGASQLSSLEEENTEELGKLIAQQGWVTLTGGEPAGVVELALKGAVEAGGETVGIMWGNRNHPFSEYITIPIFTEAELGRDYFNVLSSDVVVVPSSISAGTLIEVAYAIKKKIPIVMLGSNPEDQELLRTRAGDLVAFVNSPKQAIEEIQSIIT